MRYLLVKLDVALTCIHDNHKRKMKTIILHKERKALDIPEPPTIQ